MCKSILLLHTLLPFILHFGRYWTIDGLDRATGLVAPTEDLMLHGSIVH